MPLVGGPLSIRCRDFPAYVLRVLIYRLTSHRIPFRHSRSPCPQATPGNFAASIWPRCHSTAVSLHIRLILAIIQCGISWGREGPEGGKNGGADIEPALPELRHDHRQTGDAARLSGGSRLRPLPSTPVEYRARARQPTGAIHRPNSSHGSHLDHSRPRPSVWAAHGARAGHDARGGNHQPRCARLERGVATVDPSFQYCAAPAIVRGHSRCHADTKLADRQRHQCRRGIHAHRL
jgi:hypothetical protein